MDWQSPHTEGAVYLLGDPRPEAAATMNIVEGLADSLALASRAPDNAAAVGGASGLKANSLAGWFYRCPSVTVCADDDPDGIEGDRRLRRLLSHRGV